MKKLKTNWSIKKSDITRSLSRIRKTSGRPALEPVSEVRVAGRRRVSRRSSAAGQAGPAQQDPTLFYITLTIEEDSQPPLTIVPGSNSNDSDVESNTYSQVAQHSHPPSLPSTQQRNTELARQCKT